MGENQYWRLPWPLYVHIFWENFKGNPDNFQSQEKGLRASDAQW